MTTNTLSKAREQTAFFESILALAFSGNEQIWDRKTPERRFLEKFKKGELDIADDGKGSVEVMKFFLGALLSTFVVFPAIGNSLMRFESGDSEQISLMLEGGRRLKLAVGKWVPEIQDLICYYKQKILGWEKAPATFGKDDWQVLRDVFKYSQLRLGGEQSFLKAMVGSPKKIMTLLKDPAIRMDSLFVVLSALPISQLNMFFIEISQYIPEYFTSTTADGLYIDVRHYFAQSSVDAENLFGKIKILLMLYARHEIVIDYVIEEKTKEILLKFLQNDAVRASTLEEIEKTLYGQYQPRLDFAKAFSKILS